jgi:hypothetical protein
MAGGTAKSEGEDEISRSKERADEVSALLSEPGSASPGAAQETEPIKVNKGKSNQAEAQTGTEGTKGTKGTEGTNKRDAPESEDGLRVGISANMLLKKRPNAA